MEGETLLTIVEIYKDNSKIVYGFLLSYTKDPSLSEELTQETFLRAIKSIHKYNGECKISVWLCQIAKHLLFQEWEKRGKTINISFDENITISTNSTETIVISNENKKNIYKIIQYLDNSYKEVMIRFLTILILLFSVTLTSIILLTFYTEVNTQEGILTLIFLTFISVAIIVKFIVPLIGLVFSIVYLKETHKKILILPIIIFGIWLLSSVYIYIRNLIYY